MLKIYINIFSQGLSTMTKKTSRLHATNKALNKRPKKSNASTNPDRKIKGNTSGKNNSLRSASTIRRLKMYNAKMPDKEKMHQRPTEAARVDPNRKWFGNVRTIDQKALEKLRIQIAKKEHDPTKIFIKKKKIPQNLISTSMNEPTVRLLQTQTYEKTFGPKSRRKKVKLSVENFEEMVEEVEKKKYEQENDRDLMVDQCNNDRDENRDKRMSAGQSKRIWEQLHKVLDSSDVVVQVLDARDPEGTRSHALQEFIAKNRPHKHIVLLLNKADLVPLWVLKKWLVHLSKQHPTIAFRSHLTKPFGKGSLINLFRQFDILHRDKKNISIGFVGYPNVGKSSVINTLKEKKVCKAAPVPGETKVWQYITLTKRIYLIDCPGTVHVKEGKDDVDSVLKGCVRAEKIDAPTYYIEYLLNKSKKADIQRIYGIEYWSDADDFLTKLSHRKGKLKKGGEADVEATAKLVLFSWQRGQIPYYSLPEGEVDCKLEQHQDDDKVLDQVKEQELMGEIQIPENVIHQQIEIEDEEPE